MSDSVPDPLDDLLHEGGRSTKIGRTFLKGQY